MSPSPRPAAGARRDWRELAAIAAGGALGALARVALGRTFANGAPGFPWTIFLINVAGAFTLGYLITRLQERLPLSTYRRPFAGTGFCGAFTTFSTLQLDLFRLVDGHHYGLAAAYVIASVVGGYAAVSVATALARGVRVLA